MIRILFAALLPVMLPAPSFAQMDVKTGEWKGYFSYTTGVNAAQRGQSLYCITTGGLHAFDPATKATQGYSTLDGFSGVNPICIYHSAEKGITFLGYEDGVIDYFSDPTSPQAIKDILRNDFYTQKGINGFASDAERLYAATDFGLVIFNINTLLPIFTVTQFGASAAKLPVLGAALYEGRIWVAMGAKGLFSAGQGFANLSDPAAWRKESGANGFPGAATIFGVTTDGNWLYARNSDRVYRRLHAGNWEQDPDFNFTANNFTVQDSFVSASGGGRVCIRPRSGTAETRWYPNGEMRATFLLRKTLYLMDIYRGLLALADTGFVQYHPDGPAANNCIDMAAGNGELYVTPGGEQTSDYSGAYYFKHGKEWKQLTQGQGLSPNRASANYARALYDANTRRAYLGSWGVGLSVVYEGQSEAFYDCNTTPEGMSRAFTACDTTNIGNVRVSGMAFDSDSTLWLNFSYGFEPLTCRTRNGEWHKFLNTQFPSAPMRDVIADDFGTKWMIQGSAGLVTFNDNRTLTNRADDKVLSLGSGDSRGGLPSDLVKSLALDLDGYIWVGTEKGVAVFYDLGNIAQGRIVNASLPVFDRAALLKNESINVIAVDGGNRKWFGTNSGLYLISPDGTKLVARFTKENSPLPSDKIVSIAIDNQTGEVFFGTDRGIVSYRGDATTGAKTCDALFVFPNPVRQLDANKITIQGIAAESNVRITNAAGILVRELTSEGGTVVWDGVDVYGNRATPGFYLALATTADGENACIGKFSIID